MVWLTLTILLKISLLLIIEFHSEYLADDLLARFADFMCPAHVPDGQTCATPLMPGVYGGEPAIETVLPELPDILVDLIGAGTYEAKATIKNPDDSEMTCIYVRVELA